MLDYEKDMHIEPSALDLEWHGQAALAMKYNAYYADCKTTVMITEEKVKYIRSVLIDKVTRKPSLAGVDKVTAPVLEAYYRTHKKYLKAKKAWMDAVEELTTAELAKNEIAFTRKAALENLVILHGQSYFAGPKVPHDLKKMVEDKNKKTNANISSKLKSKKRRNK